MSSTKLRNYETRGRRMAQSELGITGYLQAGLIMFVSKTGLRKMHFCSAEDVMLCNNERQSQFEFFN